MNGRTRSTKRHMSPLSLLPLPLHSFQPEPTSQLELMRDPAELRVFLQERAGELQALALGALQDAAREALPVAAAVAAEGVAAIRAALAQRGEANVILATGSSQFGMLDALMKSDIDFSKVRAFC